MGTAGEGHFLLQRAPTNRVTVKTNIGNNGGGRVAGDEDKINDQSVERPASDLE